MKRFDSAHHRRFDSAHRGRFKATLRSPFWLCLVVAVVSLAGLTTVARGADGETARRLPTFDMKALDEQEHSLTDERFDGKPVLVTSFSTWQQSSIEQARELQKFHEAHPDVQIVAFVADSLPRARDFRVHEGLTFECYKLDGTAPVADIFSRLFKTKRGRELALNRVPFVILADKDRNVSYADIGLNTADELSEELAKIDS